MRELCSQARAARILDQRSTISTSTTMSTRWRHPLLTAKDRAVSRRRSPTPAAACATRRPAVATTRTTSTAAGPSCRSRASRHTYERHIALALSQLLPMSHLLRRASSQLYSRACISYLIHRKSHFVTIFYCSHTRIGLCVLLHLLC